MYNCRKQCQTLWISFSQDSESEYCIEIALVIFVIDLWQTQDGGDTSILALLDLMVAFNTIDHGILLD